MQKFVKFCKVVDTPKAQIFIFGVIIFNALLLGMETFPGIEGTTFGLILRILNAVCLAIYVVELLMRIIVYRLSYFRSAWNIFDFLIVGVSLISSIEVLAILRLIRLFRIFRLFRVLRLLRIVSGLEKLRVLVESILRSLPSIGWVFALLLIVLYMFSVITTILFGEAFPEFFGTLFYSMFTLFTMMTLEGWPDIAREVMVEYPYAYAIFIPYVLLTAFIVLNVFVGIIVDSMGAVVTQSEEKALDEETADMPTMEQLKAELAAAKKHIGKMERLIEAASEEKEAE